MAAEVVPSEHRHLRVVHHGPERRLGQRWTIVGLSAAAIALYVASYFTPWWSLTLFAPQYPHGLSLDISLTGMSGDVREIDLLNHYIGMSHLEDAAPFERAMAGWGVGLLGFMVLAFTLLPGKKLSWLLAAPAIAFPVTFLGDAFYWLYRFGHHLNPHAPLHFKAFTPHLFGLGIIGQFSTWAVPQVGFWLACGGIVLLLAAVVLRRRVCSTCAAAANCGPVCRFMFIGPRAGEEK